MDERPAKRDRVVKRAFAIRAELIAYARALLGNHELAEDVVQEAMLVVMRKFDEFEEGSSMLAWCRAIVRLEVLRAKQRKQREMSLVDRLLSDAIDAAFEEFQWERRRDEAARRRSALERCMAEVSGRGRQLLAARFGEELGYQEIARRLGMNLEAVRKALFRIKKRLRRCVERDLGGVS
jgi:RNA polymerase sigma-70 factor (ECF subfamily)